MRTRKNETSIVLAVHLDAVYGGDFVRFSSKGKLDATETTEYVCMQLHAYGYT